MVANLLRLCSFPFCANDMHAIPLPPQIIRNHTHLDMNFLSVLRPFTNSIKTSFWKFICKCATHQMYECALLYLPLFRSSSFRQFCWIHVPLFLCARLKMEPTPMIALWTLNTQLMHTHIQRIDMRNVYIPSYLQMCGNHFTAFQEGYQFLARG